MLDNAFGLSSHLINWKRHQTHTKATGPQIALGDPRNRLSNIIEVAAIIAKTRGDNVMLPLRVAAAWTRIGKRDIAVKYLLEIAAQHYEDAFSLGNYAIRVRLNYIRYFLTRIGAGEKMQMLEHCMADGQAQKQASFWSFTRSHKNNVSLIVDTTAYILETDEEKAINELLTPSFTWFELLYLTPMPHVRQHIQAQLDAIDEREYPWLVVQQLHNLVTSCQHWHERQSDTPIWVHELDDIGTRLIYLAVTLHRPDVLLLYLEKCLEILKNGPLAVIQHVATAIGGLGFLAKQLHIDVYLFQAIDCLQRLPEYERCISALTLVEVLLDRQPAD